MNFLAIRKNTQRNFCFDIENIHSSFSSLELTFQEMNGFESLGLEISMRRALTRRRGTQKWTQRWSKCRARRRTDSDGWTCRCKWPAVRMIAPSLGSLNPISQPHRSSSCPTCWSASCRCICSTTKTCTLFGSLSEHSSFHSSCTFLSSS